MKNLMVILFAMILATVSLTAQNKNSAKDEKTVDVLAKERVEAMQKEFALTDKQCEELIPFYEVFYSESKKLPKSPEAKKQMQKLRDDVNKEVESRLNEVQLLKYKEKQKRMSERGANRKDNNLEENKGGKKKQ
ncbi:MAG: hypothetical protein ACRCTF_07880 [Bacteroidales bacterium]